MPERGRPTAEAGNTYHDVVTANYLVDMLRNPRLLSVRPESVSEVDDIELEWDSGRRDFAQVKEHSPGATWTLASLKAERVVATFHQQHVLAPSARLLLISGSDAHDLRETSERARSALDSNADIDGAVAEWKTRLGPGLQSLVDGTADATKLSEGAVLRLFAAIDVLDNHGRLEQLRIRLTERLSEIAVHPEIARQELERVAREASRVRRRIYRKALYESLKSSPAQLRGDRVPTPLDTAAYGELLARAAEELDVAHLPDLEVNIEPDNPHPIGAHELERTAVLIGGHGSGKTRLAIGTARAWLSVGRPGLFLPLNRYTGSIETLLESELPQLTGIAARPTGADLVRKADAFLVLDGLDEVPAEHRAMAVRQVDEWSRRWPKLQVLLTSRDLDEISTMRGWSVLEIAPLAIDQVGVVLEDPLWRHHIPENLVGLIRNPLLLAQISASRKATGHYSVREIAIQDDFIRVLVERELPRAGFVDLAAGTWILQEYAYEWLLSGQINLSQTDAARIRQAVAKRARDEAVASVDARQVGDWVRGVGLAVVQRHDRGEVPAHRTILDILASHALERRSRQDALSAETLREACAISLGRATDVSMELLDDLDAVAHADYPVLSRARRLADRDIKWSGTAEEFARRYISALRTIERAHFGEVSHLLPEAVEVSVDEAIHWISELESDGDDHASESAQPMVLSMSMGDGRSIPVESFSTSGATGQRISIPVPHYVTFERVERGLLELIKRRELPNEGRDIVYERLVECRDLATRVIGRGSTPAWTGASAPGVSFRAIGEGIRNFVNDAVRNSELKDFDPDSILVAWSPRDRHVFFIGPVDVPPVSLDLKAGRTGLVLHVGVVSRLLRIATSLGIADLPLHGLKLSPDGLGDEILDYPEREGLLNGEQMLEYAIRSERAVLHAFRVLVEENLKPLASSLSGYRQLPQRVEMWLTERPGASFRWHAAMEVSRSTGEDDEVRGHLGTPDATRKVNRWALVPASHGVRDRAYKLLGDDIKDAFSGGGRLGSRAL